MGKIFAPGGSSTPLQAKGDLFVRDATGSARQPIGTDGYFLKANSSQTTGMEWASGAANLSVVSKTTTYTALTSDDLILCSGSTFTVTLFTAVGNAGKIISFKKTDSSTSNIITVDGNGSETIDGALTKSLYLQYQSFTIVSDGANWILREENVPNVGVFATTTAGPSIASGAVPTVVFGTETEDTANAYNSSTGVFTCPCPGKYVISGSVRYASASFTNGNNLSLSVYKNGTYFVILEECRIQVTQSTAHGNVFGTVTIELGAGDTIELRTAHDEASSRSLTTLAGRNYIAISRVR